MSPQKRFFLMMVVACAFLIQTLDASVLNTSFPQIARAFSIDAIHLKIAITSYLLSVGILIPTCPYLAEKVGIKRLYLFACLVFLLASIGCAFSQDLTQLVIFRVLQGVGGAFLAPMSRLIMLKVYPKDQLLQGQNLSATIASLGLLAGPIIGGALTTYLSWRYIFFMNVPVLLVVMVFAYSMIPNFKKHPPPPFDCFGFLTIAMALVCLLLTCDFFPDPEFSMGLKLSIMLFALGLVVIFAWRQWSANHPLFSRDLWRKYSLRLYLPASFISRISLFSLSFIIPLLLQTSYGLTAWHSGLMMTSMALGLMCGKLMMTLINRLIPQRILLMSCLTLSSLCFGWLSLVVNHPHFMMMFIILFFISIFLSTCATLYNVGFYQDLERKLQAEGTALNSITIQLGSAFAMAVAALLLIVLSGHHQTQLHLIPKPIFRSTLQIESLFPLISMAWMLVLHRSNTGTLATRRIHTPGKA